MKAFIFALWMYGILTLVMLGCSKGVVSRPQAKLSGDHPGESSNPAVEVKVVAPTLSNNLLDFRWEMMNTSAKPIFIYYALLENPASAEYRFDHETRTLQVLFLSLQTIPAIPYYYPEPSFIKIPPGQSIQGHFAGKRSIGDLTGPTQSGKHADEGSAAASQWRVEVLVAYGEEIESVQKAIRELKGAQHPINPIVRWQRIAHSQPVFMTVQSTALK